MNSFLTKIARDLQICILIYFFFVRSFSNGKNYLKKALKTVILWLNRVCNKSMEMFGIQIIIQNELFLNSGTCVQKPIHNTSMAHQSRSFEKVDID